MNTWTDDLYCMLSQIEDFFALVCDARSAEIEADIAMHGAILARKKSEKEIYACWAVYRNIACASRCISPLTWLFRKGSKSFSASGWWR